MAALMTTRYVRYEEISFVRPPGARHQEEAVMMRRARAEVETGSLRPGEQVESVEVWGSETQWTRSCQAGPVAPAAGHLTLYWYRVTITGAGN